MLTTSYSFKKLPFVLMDTTHYLWTCFVNVVAANKLFWHVGFGCTTYQGPSKPSPGSLQHRKEKQTEQYSLCCYYYFPSLGVLRIYMSVLVLRWYKDKNNARDTNFCTHFSMKEKLLHQRRWQVNHASYTILWLFWHRISVR